MMPRLQFLLALCAVLPCAAQQSAAPHQVRAYKSAGADSLVVHVFSPPVQRQGRAAVVLFHGGGFVWGGPEVTDGSAAWYAAQGMVAFSVEYRLADRKTVTPVEQLEDAYDAIRWVRAHAREFGVAPNRIVGHGVSAGGYLVAMAAGSADESARPNAMVLWSPGVGDGGDDPYITSLLLGRAKPSDISPVTRLRSPMPPAIIISGQYDSVTFDADSRKYCDKLRAVNARCDMHSYPNLGHTLSRRLDARSQLNGRFDWDPVATADADAKVTAFLTSIGFVAAKPKNVFHQ